MLRELGKVVLREAVVIRRLRTMGVFVMRLCLPELIGHVHLRDKLER